MFFSKSDFGAQHPIVIIYGSCDESMLNDKQSNTSPLSSSSSSPSSSPSSIPSPSSTFSTLDSRYYNQHLPEAHFLAHPSPLESASSRFSTHQPMDNMNSPLSPPQSLGNSTEHINNFHNPPQHQSYANEQPSFHQVTNCAPILRREHKHLEGNNLESLTIENGKRLQFWVSPLLQTADAYPANYPRAISPAQHFSSLPASNSLSYCECNQESCSNQAFKADSQSPVWQYHNPQASASPSHSFSTEPLPTVPPELGSIIVSGTSYPQTTSPTANSMSWDSPTRNGARTTFNTGTHRSSSAPTSQSSHYGSTARSSNTSLHEPEDPLYSTSNEAFTTYSPPIIYQDHPPARAGHPKPMKQPYYECKTCTQRLPNYEIFVKHQLKHQKLHRCRVAGCSRTEGFTTTNDRDRHEKSVHKTPGMYFRCLDVTCSSYKKVFARRDNLKDHLKRMHRTPDGLSEAEANERRNQLADEWKVDLSASQPTGDTTCSATSVTGMRRVGV